MSLLKGHMGQLTNEYYDSQYPYYQSNLVKFQQSQLIF